MNALVDNLKSLNDDYSECLLKNENFIFLQRIDTLYERTPKGVILSRSGIIHVKETKKELFINGILKTVIESTKNPLLLMNVMEEVCNNLFSETENEKSTCDYKYLKSNNKTGIVMAYTCFMKTMKEGKLMKKKIVENKYYYYLFEFDIDEMTKLKPFQIAIYNVKNELIKNLDRKIDFYRNSYDSTNDISYLDNISTLNIDKLKLLSMFNETEDKNMKVGDIEKLKKYFETQNDAREDIIMNDLKEIKKKIKDKITTLIAKNDNYLECFSMESGFDFHDLQENLDSDMERKDPDYFLTIYKIAQSEIKTFERNLLEVNEMKKYYTRLKQKEKSKHFRDDYRNYLKEVEKDLNDEKMINRPKVCHEIARNMKRMISFIETKENNDAIIPLDRK